MLAPHKKPIGGIVIKVLDCQSKAAKQVCFYILKQSKLPSLSQKTLTKNQKILDLNPKKHYNTVIKSLEKITAC
jgi:hypothetical protein